MKGTIKKIIPYLLLVLIFVGVFGGGREVEAQQTVAQGYKCWVLSGTTWSAESTNIVGSAAICQGRGTWAINSPQGTQPPTSGQCVDGITGSPNGKTQATCLNPDTWTPGTVTQTPAGQCVDSNGIPNGKNYTDCSAPNTWKTDTAAPAKPSDTSGIENNLPACAFPIPDIAGCLVKISYYLLNVLPAWILALSGMFLNAMVALTLSNKFISNASFINDTWAVVRDISNIFFILILLYVAFKTILSMGGSETKKMIGQVIIMAVLINFSMFFTKVIIDTANVIALVFYNKINTETTINGELKTYIPTTSAPVEKDISGGLMNAFNPGKLLSKEFFEAAKQRTDVIPASAGRAILGSILLGPAVGASAAVLGYFMPSAQVPLSLIFGIIVVSGAIMIFAAYAFFMAGISFMGRLIELCLLIIFSPFAFMSWAVPKLAHTSLIGWDDWLSKLISTSFMAPIFMFFMYFIFKIVNSNIFSGLSRASTDKSSTTETVLFVIIPAMLILMMLLKAADFAKKGGGKFAEFTLGAIKAATVLGVGAATGGAALAGRATVGATATFLQNDRARAGAMSISQNLSKLKGLDKVNPFALTKVITNSVAARTAERISGTEYGQELKASEEGARHKAHAEHVLNDKAKAVYHEEEFDKLSEPEKLEIKKSVDRDILAKAIYKSNTYDGMNDTEKKENIEKIIKKSYDETNPLNKDKDNNIIIGNIEANLNAFRVEMEKKTKDKYDTDMAVANSMPTNTTQAQEAQRQAIKEATEAKEKATKETERMKFGDHNHDSRELEAMLKADEKLGEISKLLRKGTYDARNLAELSMKNKSWQKTTIALLAGTAFTMRTAMKKLGGVDVGKGQGAYYKDLKSTIVDALSHVKVDLGGLSAGGGGGGHGGDDHGGGHGHGGGGHH